MKLSTITVVLLAAFLTMSACKTSYMKKFKKEARKEVGKKNISIHSDTVKVVYPEVSMFDFNKDEIKPDAAASLARFAALLTKYDRINFVINGYTDNVGTADVNQSLSQRRADNAKMLFSTNHIADNRMQSHGMGASNPVIDNTTDAGRAANRRVEILLYEKKK